MAILTAIVAIAALLGGQGGAQAINTDGYGFGWGSNGQGQLGNGRVADDSVPVAVGTGANVAGTWAQLESAWQSSASCGIGGDDSAYCWGPNGLGQVGDGTKDNRYDGPVLVSAGANPSGSWKAITVGGEFWTCGIGGDDRAYCWGYNDLYGNAATPGFLGNGTARTSDDSIPRAVSNGANSAGTWKSLSSGWPVTCGIGTDDRAYCWGPNSTGALGNGSVGYFSDDSVPRLVSNGANTAGTWTQVSVGNRFACGVATNSSIYCWGSLISGAAATTPTLLANGANTAGTWRSVSAGRDQACAIGTDDRAYCWGYGPTGDGTGVYSADPVKVVIPGDPAVTAVSTSRWGTNYFTCAIAGGTVYCWGANGSGQLGDGQQPTSSNSAVTVVTRGVLDGRTPLAISSGESSVFLITGPATATVTYDANQATSGSPPAAGTGTVNSTFTVAGNTGSLARSGYSFVGWNTNDQGTGTSYAAGTGTLTLTGDITLYAQWQVQAPPPAPPPPQPPQPPRLLTAAAGNAQVTLTWARPDWEGSTPVTQYRVFSSPGGQVCVTAQLTCTATGLANGQPYSFTVIASSSVGDSPPSRSLTATPLADPPGPPVLTSVTARDKQAVVTWDPPASDGGAPITEYRVNSSIGGQVCTVAATAPPLTCTVSGLVNGRYYSFWVTAVNSAGESPRSNVLGVQVAPALPGKPRDVEGTAGDKRIYVAWRPPEDAGDAPVDRYEVGLVNGGRTCVVAAPETACTVTGLTPGTTYVARVRARSSVGWGPWAFGAPIVVPPNPPPGISVRVRRLPKDPDEVAVTGRTTGIRAGTALWVWIHRMTDEGYMQSFQGLGRPVVQDDGTFTWERKAPANRVWEVIWCTEPGVQGTCSRWTVLADSA